MTTLIDNLVRRNRAGEAIAIPSVCSGHFDVLRACLSYAAKRGESLIIEATSNQVNQDGGYTGMTPALFIRHVHELVDSCHMDRAQVIFGGDHLGPQAWRYLPAEAAMNKAETLVIDYVKAGFSKIHLDCSEGCRGEPPCHKDHITASRSATLARACLKASASGSGPVFVIGTEVPPPGGAKTDDAGHIATTPVHRARTTLTAHKQAFSEAGIDDQFDRVVGLVVQPGVEFSPMQVYTLPRARRLAFRKMLKSWPGICLEAHSTDYQPASVYRRLARSGFAFQKVGPALTFAWREAVYALDGVRQMITGRDRLLMNTMERLMCAEPEHWLKHYTGDQETLFLARHFGYADRIRYYWPKPEAREALKALKSWVKNQKLPEPLLRQVFSAEVLDCAESLSGSLFDRLVHASVHVALDPYFFNPSA